MATVRKSKGFLFIDYRVGGKRERDFLKLKDTKENRKIAEIRKKQIEADIATGVLLERKKRIVKNNLTLAEGLDKYFLKHKIKESTKTNYSSAVKKFIEHAGNLKINKITPELIDDIEEEILKDKITVLRKIKSDNGKTKVWKKFELDRNISENTIASYFNQLRVLFNFFIDKKYILENPFEHKEIKINRIITMSDKDISDILSKLRSKNRNHYRLISFLLLTGLRKNEIINIKFDDIDFENNLIYIFNHKEDRVDTLPLHNVLKNLINTEWEKKEGKLFNYKSKDSLKFFDRFLKKEGYKEYSFHTLRKTYITKLINSGMSIYDVKTLARHKNIRTTFKHYAKAEIDRMGREISSKTNFDEILGTHLGTQKKKVLKLIKSA